MKKLIAVIMILAMLVPAAAPADTSFDDLTFDELSVLNQLVQLKMFEKGALTNGVSVPPGVYRIGEDIPEGYYRIVYEPPYETAFCSFFINEEGGGVYSTMLGFSGSNEIGKVFLQNNAIVTITDSDLLFYTYTGLFH